MKTVRIYFTFFKFWLSGGQNKFYLVSEKSYRYVKIILKKKIFQEYNLAINSLEPDQTQHFVGPDLGLNCFSNVSSR